MKSVWLWALFWVLVIPVVAVAGETTDAVKGVLTPFVMFGGSLIGSLVTGRLQKEKTKIPNDLIAGTNPAIWGGTAGAIGGDALSIVAGVAGSMAATLIHQVWKKVAPDPPKPTKKKASKAKPRNRPQRR